MSGPKSSPFQIENDLRNVAKIYYLKTEQDFFEAFPNILKVINDLKNACEPPKQGTKRTLGKDEEIWKDFCSYAGKTKDFEENEVTEFLKKSISQRNIPKDVKDQKLNNCMNSIAAIYNLKTNRKFDMDFPNVQQFVLNLKETYDEGMRDFKCNFCTNSYFWNQDLKRHIERTHARN